MHVPLPIYSPCTLDQVGLAIRGNLGGEFHQPVFPCVVDHGQPSPGKKSLCEKRTATGNPETSEFKSG